MPFNRFCLLMTIYVMGELNYVPANNGYLVRIRDHITEAHFWLCYTLAIMHIKCKLYLRKKGPKALNLIEFVMLRLTSNARDITNSFDVLVIYKIVR